MSTSIDTEERRFRLNGDIASAHLRQAHAGAMRNCSGAVWYDEKGAQYGELINRDGRFAW